MGSLHAHEFFFHSSEFTTSKLNAACTEIHHAGGVPHRQTVFTMPRTSTGTPGGGGGTDAVGPVRRQGPALIRWAFTFNNYDPLTLEDFEQVLRTLSKRFIYQRERGVVGTDDGGADEQGGTPHLQGYVELRKRTRLTQLKRLLPPQIHWEKAKGTDEENIAYCSKLLTREDPEEEPTKWGFAADIRVVSTLRRWQQGIVDIVKREPDDRTVHWYWDSVGGVGKTALAKYLVVKPEFNAVYMNGKGADIKFFLTKHFAAQDTNKDNLICIWDLSRTSEDFIPYGSIEALKNGLFFSGKYESEMVVFNSPHVIVFANYPPDQEKLSGDRWHIVELQSGLGQT